MFRKQLPLLLLCLLPITAYGAEADGSGLYCFRQEDFGSAPLTGICLRQVPQKEGVLRLGSREVRPGDVLTADQLAQLTFAPRDPEQDSQLQLEYLPISAEGVDREVSLNLTIRGREDKPPVAEDSALETYKNLPNTGRLKVHDPEGQPMTFSLVRPPKRGTVELGTDGSFTYTPKNNKVGIDSFTYTATDPAGKVSREATVTVTILKPTAAARYADTAGEDCCFAAEWMKNTGIFTGEALAGNPCFHPEKAVTRGEFVSMLVKTLDIPVDRELTVTGYTDEVPGWLKPYLAAAVRSGLTAGFSGERQFRPEEAMLGADAAAMLCSALDLEQEGALDALDARGISLEGDQPLTRGNTAQILYRVKQLTQEQ